MHYSKITFIFVFFCFCATVYSSPLWAISSEYFGDDLPIISLEAKKMSKVQMNRALAVRACNTSIPLPGGIDANQASSKDFFKALENYSEMEAAYRPFQNKLSMYKSKVGSEFDKDTLFMATAKIENIESDENLAYFYKRNEGLSLDAMKRFSETFAILSLYKEGDYRKALEELDKLRQKRGINLQYKQLDEVEESTYFTKQTLDNILGFVKYKIEYDLRQYDPEKLFKSAKKYLKDRDALLPVLKLFDDLFFDETMLSVIIDQGKIELSKELIELENSPFKAVWESKKGLYVTVESDQKPYTIFRQYKPDYYPSGAGGGRGGSGDDSIGLNSHNGSNGGGRRNFESNSKDWMRNGSTLMISGKLALRNYREFIQKELAKNSTEDMNLFHIFSMDSSYEILHGLHTNPITISKDEYFKLLERESLNNKPELGKLMQGQGKRRIASVRWTSPAIVSKSQRVDGDKLVYALQHAYPDSRVYRDSFSEKTLFRTKLINNRRVEQSKSYIALVADKSFSIQDYNIVSNLNNEFREAGVEVVHYQKKPLAWNKKEGLGVIVITGDSNENLLKFVRNAGTSGAFRNNLVILNSCGTKVSEEIAENINKSYGANGVLVFDDIIDVAKVEDLLADFLGKLNEANQEYLTEYLQKLLIKNGLKAVWYISRVGVPSSMRGWV